jgi:Holliday junction resolvase RusA-like endonuclease
MKVLIQFFMPMVPPTVTAQEHKIAVRNGKPIVYDTSEIKSAKSKLTAYLAEHKPEQPFACGVRLIVKWCFPRGEHQTGTYRTTRPDTDNLQKLLKDCMTKCGFWKDDALVCSEITEKFWAEIPGIWIRIEEV